MAHITQISAKPQLGGISCVQLLSHNTGGNRGGGWESLQHELKIQRTIDRMVNGGKRYAPKMEGVKESLVCNGQCCSGK